MDHEVSTQPKARITPEEYLALERKAERRSEYLDGEMFPVPGATKEHIQITRNITVELSLQFKDSPCEVYPLEMRTKVSATGLYTYPDIAVVCGEIQFEDANFETLLNPILIIEVLSDSTESYDRGRKFAHYRNIPSLQEYVLVSQSEYRIEKFSRVEDGSWKLTESTDPSGSMQLHSVGGRLTIPSVYDKVDLDRAKKRRDRVTA
jgi:Uma2 family endonuclease